MSGADPGWGAAFRVTFPFGTLDPRKMRTTDGLTTIRTIFIGLVSALPLFAVAFSYVIEEPGPAGIAPQAVVATGLVSILGIIALQRRPLSAGSAASLAESWRTRFFIEVGVAETPAVVGLAFTTWTDRLWIYLVGMGFATVGFWRIGPTRRNLDRDQEAIRSVGSSLDLTEALMTTGPSTPSQPDAG